MKLTLTAVLLALSFPASAEWVAQPFYYLQQKSSGGSVRYVETQESIGIESTKSFPKTESTILTVWTTQDYFYIQYREDGKKRNELSTVKVKFLGAPPPPPPPQECAPIPIAFGKLYRLSVNATPQDPNPCMGLGFKTLADGTVEPFMQDASTFINGVKSCPLK